VTASAAGPWQSETAWVDSGGGITKNGFAIPSWQQLPGVITSANHGSTTLRNGPDVSANANFTFYTCSNQTTCLANSYGGTSFAAPMWAGYIALANQQLAAQHQSVGFLNPAIYQQNVNASTFAADFHDITSGTSGSYSAVAGYDLVTGWGSPNAGLMAALTGGGTSQTPAFTISASPASVSVTAGGSVGSTVSTSVSGGESSAISLTASAPPSGVTVGFSSTSIAAPGSGSSTVTFTTTSSAAAGTYPITITGTDSGGTTHTTTINLTVNAQAQTGDFSVSASPSSMTVARNGSGVSTISVVPSGGFTSTVALSATGGGGGVSFSLSPATVSGTGSSTLTVTVSRNAPPSTRTITITATGGGKTHTTTVAVTVTH
jgi:kumamolisin